MIDLRLGDCLEVMKTIPDNSIDAIITDPPYGTTACKWDSVIPFDLMWSELNRIIKPNGAIVLFGSEPFSSALRMSNIKNYKYDWIWEKTKAGNFQIVKYQPLKYHEIISVFSKKPHKYYPIKVEASESSKNRYKYKISKSKGKLNHMASGEFKYSENHDKNLKNPSSVIKQKSVVGQVLITFTVFAGFWFSKSFFTQLGKNAADGVSQQASNILKKVSENIFKKDIKNPMIGLNIQ